MLRTPLIALQIDPKIKLKMPAIILVLTLPAIFGKTKIVKAIRRIISKTWAMVAANSGPINYFSMV